MRDRSGVAVRPLPGRRATPRTGRPAGAFFELRVTHRPGTGAEMTTPGSAGHPSGDADGGGVSFQQIWTIPDAEHVAGWLQTMHARITCSRSCRDPVDGALPWDRRSSRGRARAVGHRRPAARWAKPGHRACGRATSCMERCSRSARRRRASVSSSASRNVIAMSMMVS